MPDPVKYALALLDALFSQEQSTCCYKESRKTVSKKPPMSPAKVNLIEGTNQYILTGDIIDVPSFPLTDSCLLPPVAPTATKLPTSPPTFTPGNPTTPKKPLLSTPLTKWLLQLLPS